MSEPRNMADKKWRVQQITFVRASEGGYVDDPVDRGGETQSGITEDSWAEYCRSTGYAGVGGRRADEVEIASFYQWWWGRPELGLLLLADPGVQLSVFDVSFLFGRGRAAKWLQLCVRALGGVPLVIDGFVGMKSAAAVNRCRAEDVITWMAGTVGQYHRDVVANKPAQGKFLRGWLARCDRRKAESLRMSGEYELRNAIDEEL